MFYSLRFTFGSAEAKSTFALDLKALGVKSVVMEVKESTKEDNVLTLNLEGAVDEISLSVVIVSPSGKTFAADTEVVIFFDHRNRIIRR